MTALANKQVDMKLEVVLLDVSDVVRTKAFYEKLGWRLDIDVEISDKAHAVQMTPPHSEASIIFGKGITSAHHLVLTVNNIDAARSDLIARGVDVSEIFHFAGGPFNTTLENPRVSGRDPEGRPYFTFASFEDPEGNGWLLQEVQMRAPGREWKKDAGDVNTLAELLHETAERHDYFEKTHGKHDWWDWYAPYLAARQNGSTPEEASAAADRQMDEVLSLVTT